jgi:hypothetical protein
MKLKLNLITLIALLILSTTCLRAQTAAPAFTASHMKAAERMLIASGIQTNLQKLFTTIIETQSKRLPEEKRTAFTNVMNKFLGKYASWENLKTAFEPIYATEFSEDELNQISDFLTSSAGKKMVEKQPNLFKKGSEWGQKIFQEHQEELEQMMKDAFQQDPPPVVKKLN